MLYNYYNFKYYDIHIKNLLNYYRAFNTDNITKKLINRWMQILEKYYTNNTAKAIINNVDFEFFQEKVIVSDICEFYIHFDISEVQKRSHKYKSQNINSAYLVANNIDYEQQYVLSNYHYQSQKPIIIVDFPLSLQSEKIVIDGNHRLSAKIKTNSDISFIYLHTSDVLEIIPQSFEKAFYCFMIDLNNYTKIADNKQKIDFIKKYSLSNLFVNYIQ